MERLKLKNKGDLKRAVASTKKVLENGGLVIYPTDTIYGLAVDATNNQAITKVYKIKERNQKKPLTVILSSFEQAEKYTEVSDLAKKVAQRVLPGPFTILLKRKNNLPEELTLGSELLGVRVPDSEFCFLLAKEFGKPFTTTSANISGKKANNVDEILNQLKENLNLIDLVIDAGSFTGEASTILDISGNSVKIVR